jgi:DNA-binding SARP family transcriptional activator/predicted ATPase
MPARLHVLGGLGLVDDGGRRHDLPLERPTVLLVVLALRGAWVRRSELAALFRPDAAEDEGLAYLRKLVFRARRLPGAADLEAEPSRLRWSVASDVGAFRAAVAAGDDAAALAHWGGPLLGGADLSGPDAVRAWLEVERGDLDRAWRAAVVRRAEARLAAGDGAAAAGAVAPLRAADPFDEEALQLELRAHLAAGRPRAAWAAFEAFRVALAAEMGVAPLEGTWALADLARPRPAAAGAAGERPAGSDAEPPSSAGPWVAGAPPIDGPLVGRLDELARVVRWWTEGVRWVTLAGLGGAGKTRLALEAARRHAAAGGRATFVAAAAFEGADDVAAAAAALMGVDVGGREPPRVALAAFLRRAPALLVLDDLAPAAARDVALWLEPLPEVRVLATAPAPHDVPGEWLVDVGGLEVPPVGADPKDFDAVRLFVARAERRAAVPFGDPAGMAAVAELCRRVEGLPLAVELAAAWTRVAPVEELLARLDAEGAAFAVDAADVAPRHRDLRRVVAASLELLGADERATLGALAAYRSDFGAAAAARVAAADLARLLRLVNLGLVGRAAGGRYRLHALVAEVVHQERTPAQRRADRAAVRRDAAAVLAAAAIDLTRRDEHGTLRALAPEFEALKAAWRDAVAARDADALAGMEEGMYLLWDARAAYHEAARAFEDALAAVPDGTPVARALGARAGYFAVRVGRWDRAEVALVAAGTDPADPIGAFVVRALGTLDLLAGRAPAAAERLEEAFRRAEALGDLDGASRAATNLGVLAQYRGDHATGETWTRRALERARAMGSLRGVAGASMNLGVGLEARGAGSEAEAAYAAARDAYVEAADPRGESAAWTNLGHVAERRGDLAGAESAYRRGLELKRALGDPVATAISLVNLADVALAGGAADVARGHLAEALALAAAAGADVVLARAVWSAARERAADGAVAEAAALAAALVAWPAAEQWVRTAAAASGALWSVAAGPAALRPGGADVARDPVRPEDAVRGAVARLRARYDDGGARSLHAT